MKRILIITATLALCACIAVVPCFAIQSGYYEGQATIHLLGAQYQVELMGTGNDAITFFATRDMYWYAEDGTLNNAFETYSSSLDNPVTHVHNEITTDLEASLAYNDLRLYIDDVDFPSTDTVALVNMTSDRFTLGSDARLGLHLNPILSVPSNDHLVPVGETVDGTVHFYALTIDGEVIDVPMYRDDLVIGGTYDLTARLYEFFEGRDIQYYWITYEGENAVPSFVQDISLRATMPWSDVFVVDWATDIVYPEVISYEDFSLLSWLGASIDGFLTTTIFSVGDVNVTLGVIVSVPLTIMILIVFLKKFAGG